MHNVKKAELATFGIVVFLLLRTILFPLTPASAVVYCFAMESIVVYWMFREYISRSQVTSNEAEIKELQEKVDDLQSKMNAFTLRMGFHS